MHINKFKSNLQSRTTEWVQLKVRDRRGIRHFFTTEITEHTEETILAYRNTDFFISVCSVISVVKKCLMPLLSHTFNCTPTEHPILFSPTQKEKEGFRRVRGFPF